MHEDLTHTDSRRLTRADLVRTGVGAGLTVALGLRSASALGASPRLHSSLVLTAAELARVRANVFDLKLGFARRAWKRTLADANNWLGYQPNPTRPGDVDPDNWQATLSEPGRRDGAAAYTLASAYAVGGRAAHAERAKAICLAWARTYNPAPPQARTGHFVAEPVGPVIKLCMAYELAKPEFTQSERAEFAAWTAQFVGRGINGADSSRDDPWVPDVTYGSDRTNVAPYGNGATWQRAMAVWAAAVVGGSTLRSTLDWNFRHRTPKGREYGWDELLEGLIIDGTGGEMSEGRYRSSIHYGHFAWAPIVLIADVARRAGHPIDLFAYRSRRHAYTVFTPFPYHARFATSQTIPPNLERTQYGGSRWPEIAALWRAFYELLLRNASDPKLVKRLRAAVDYGGPTQRGDNYNIHVLGYAALFGRGPKGPMPAQPRPKPKGKPGP
ncbi:MAG: alginate lyase family protein [Actinomycetota bacterium]